MMPMHAIVTTSGRGDVVLMMLFSGIMMFFMPKIMASMENDPDMAEEMANMQKKMQKTQNMDFMGSYVTFSSRRRCELTPVCRAFCLGSRRRPRLRRLRQVEVGAGMGVAARREGDDEYALYGATGASATYAATTFRLHPPPTTHSPSPTRHEPPPIPMSNRLRTTCMLPR